MAPKPRRTRHGRARGRPAPRRLDDDLKRYQLAREVIPEVMGSIDAFMKHFPRIARRRVADRIALHWELASTVLTWTALGAPRDEDQLPARCFAAGCSLGSDPHRLSWQGLAMSGLGEEVRTHVRRLAAEVPQLPTERPDPDALRDIADSVLDEVRSFKERLEAQQATSADGRRTGGRLLLAALALDPGVARDGEFREPATLAAIALLERTLPTHDADIRLQVAEILQYMEEGLPDALDHVAAHLEEDAEQDGHDAGEATAPSHLGELADGEEAEENPPLQDFLSAVDVRLSVTEKASEGAELALQMGCALLTESAAALRGFPAAYEARVRLWAASDVLMRGLDTEWEPAQLEGDNAAAVQMAYRRAAALLEAEVPEQPQEAEPVEVQLSHLDELVEAIYNVADEELTDEPAVGLGLLGGAVQTLRVGIRLGHQDAGRQRRMAAALGALDPLAMADLPEARTHAAQTLRELAHSPRGAGATSEDRS